MTYDPSSEPRPSANPLIDPEVWADARADYLSGLSPAVVAERYGMNERTVRRRAVAEGWGEARPPETRATRREAADRQYAELIAGLAGEPMSEEEALDEDPHLAPFVAAHTHEIGQLLMRPGPERLSRFAFRRSTEAAAADRPAEALVWMRLVQSLARTQSHLQRSARPFAPPDYMRARYAAQLSEHAGLSIEDEAVEHEHMDGPRPHHEASEAPDDPSARPTPARPDAR